MLAASQALSAQTCFPDAGQAANHLVIAVAGHDKAALDAMLGDDYRDVLPAGESEAEIVDRFLNAWATYHSLVATSDSVRLLAAGENGWTLPIPIVRGDQGWCFDMQAGRDMMRIRRIGRNELAAMQAALAYHDAQIEYAGADLDGDGVLEYAQRFISRKGKHDGLYWKTESGQPQSPLGPLFDGKLPTDAYHGYRYRILTAQGPHAPGGAESYIQGGNMVGGFALVAWPADYGNSGIMSFLMGRNGRLYEADLGPDSDGIASTLPTFDPDSRWSPVAPAYTASNP